jgi:hypothetical protein
MNYHSRKYIRLIHWIAGNDNDGEDESVAELAGYLTVKMVADCYDMHPSKVAEDVWLARSHQVNV